MFKQYFETELTQLRTLAVEFSQANPALAPLLATSSSDPDVERLLEGVAFLTARTRQKLDDEFPEVIQELTNLLCPHYLRPVPACTLIEFQPKSPLTESAKVKALSEIASIPVDATVCRFRTTQELEVLPLTLQQCELIEQAGSTPSISLQFLDNGVDYTQLQSSPLRLFLGNSYTEAAKLFMLLNTSVRGISIRRNGRPVAALSASAIHCSGFDSPLLPYPGNAFSGYGLIQEFFCLPEKFLFVEIKGLHTIDKQAGATLEINFLLNKRPDWMPAINDESFLLNIAPAVNIFSHMAIPTNANHRQAEYRIRPEGNNPEHYQIYSIDNVHGYCQGKAQPRPYLPFGVLRSPTAANPSSSGTYQVSIRPATVGNQYESFLSIPYQADQDFQDEVLSINLSCTNAHLPDKLSYGEIRNPTSTSPERLQFQNIRAVRPAQSIPADDELQWKLLTHVAMNLLTLATAENLRSLLSLYVFSAKQGQHERANRQRIAGIASVHVKSESRLVGRHMMRGQCIQMVCHSSHYAGPGDLYLFGCILERFLAGYASINTYARLEIQDSLTEEKFVWRPRLGLQELL